MTSLIKYLSPKNEDGSVDQRYSESTKILIDKLGTKGCDAIQALIQGQLALANTHGGVGMKLCDCIYELAEEIEKKEDHPHRWKSKRLRKQCQSILEGIGFTASQVTYLIKAKQFKEKLKFEAYRGRTVKVTLVRQLEFIESHGPRAQYLFSQMDCDGLRKAQKQYKLKGENLTVKELEGLKSLHPIKQRETRKDPPITIVDDDDTSATLELLSYSKADKAREFRDLAIQLHEDDAWKDTEIIEILKPIQKELFYLAHVAAQPARETITI